MALRSLSCWALLVAAVGSAGADPLPSGTWRARFATERAAQQQASLVLDASQGLWTVLPQSHQAREDQCVGGPFPVTLRDIGSSTVSLLIAASQVDPQCPDLKARLSIVDADTLEGEFEDGSILRLERLTTRR